MAQLFHVSIGYLTGYEEDNGRHGLSEDEYRRLGEEAAERLREKAWERAQEDPPDEEAEERLRQDLIQEWLNSGQGGFFETYLVGKYFEFLTEGQRKRVVTVVEQMFPLAVMGQYTDEQPRK